MKTVVLNFSSKEDLIEFQKITCVDNTEVNNETYECSGSFTEAQIELAINGMKATVKSYSNS